jgi:magnesium transporter
LSKVPEEKVIATSAEAQNGTETYEKRWFCVALGNDGSVFIDDADSPLHFLEVLSKASIAWIDFRTTDFQKDVQTAPMQLGFSKQLIASLTGESRLLYEDLGNEMGIKLPSIQIRRDKQLDVQAHPTLLLMQKKFLMTVHTTLVDRRFTLLRRYSEKILKRIPIEGLQEDKLTLLLIRVIDQNNDRNFEHLRQIEEEGDELNKSLMDPETPRNMLGPQIYDMKHSLINYLNALWESVDVLHDLRYGDADLISDDPRLLERVGYLGEDVKSQIGLAEHLSEVLASGLEVLQSIYNNQLQLFNNKLAMIMTYLTVLGTAVLVPNTLATIFGSSAFALTPDDIWWYVIVLVGSTLVATGLAFWWMRRSGWMPKKVD